MAELWLPLTDLPDEGQEFTFTDPEFWKGAWQEFKVPCSMGDAPLTATLLVVPQEGGVFLRGSIAGVVNTTCDRCSGKTKISLDVSFDEFEAAPGDGWDDEPDDEDDPGDEPRIREERGKLELDAGAILWEQFVLALPIQPLCSEACKGLCPTCGQDLNKGSCDCEEPGLDPRLAPLRNLKIS